MRISEELRIELKMRVLDLDRHADYCDERVLELLKEADEFKAKANEDRSKAKEIMNLLDTTEGGPNAPEVPITYAPHGGVSITRVNGMRAGDR